MADPLAGIDLENAYRNIGVDLTRITQEQELQLGQLRQMNVQAHIIHQTKQAHLKDEQRLSALQTNIQAKANRMLQLEARRQYQLSRGTLLGAQIATGLQAAINRMGQEAAELNRQYAMLLAKMASMQVLMETANRVGFGGLIAKSKEFREAWNVHPILGLGKVLLHMVDVFDQMDQAAARFRQNMGITREYTGTIDANAREIAFNFAHVGVSAEIAYKATEALSKSLFSTMSASKELVTDVSLMAAQLGISAGVSADFMRNMGMASRTTAGAQSDMTLFAASMAQAAGVPLGEIMQDVSNAMKSSYSYLSKSGMSLIKASVDAKRMGTTLESAAQSSKKLMDFTNSVRSEMEASVLVGKSINLQHARELAYRRDLKGLNSEILRIMKETNFENLDPFQQEAVAAALGKSADELGKMAQAERERLGWETSTDPIVKAQLAAYKEMETATEATAKARGKDMRAQLQQKANQAAIASITQSWNAILQRVGEAVLPLIDSALKGIAYVVGWINTLIGHWNALWAKGGSTLGWVGKMLSGIAVTVLLIAGAKGLGGIAKLATGALGKAVGNMLQGIGSGFSGLGKAAGSIAKGAAALILMGVAVWVFAKAIKAFAGTDWAAVFIGIGAISLLAIVAGIMGNFVPFILLGALAIAALGVAMLPFAAAAWIMSKSLQNLANVPLFNIAAGLAALGAVAPLIVMAGMSLGLAAPGFFAFSIALRFIAGPAERVGRAMRDLGTGLKMTTDSLLALQNLSLTRTVLQVRSLASAITELSAAIKGMPDLKVEKLKALVITGLAPGGGEGGGAKAQSPQETLQAIKDGIDGLRNDMKNGTLTATVYLDSQKLDTGMSRRIKYTGQLA